jgi:hypothetical protein
LDDRSLSDILLIFALIGDAETGFLWLVGSDGVVVDCGGSVSLDWKSRFRGLGWAMAEDESLDENVAVADVVPRIRSRARLTVVGDVW